MRGVLDRFTWSWVLSLSRLEQVKDVLRARRRPKSEEMVIRISEGPTATNRHETRVPNLREDHWLGAPLPFGSVQHHRAPGGQAEPSTVASFKHQGGPSLSGPGRKPTAYAVYSADPGVWPGDG
jgi:hypothetical protein